MNITGGTLTGGVHSISSEGTARVIATGTVCEKPAGYCMYAFGTSSIIYNAVVPINPGFAYAGKDSGATLSVFGGIGGGLTLAAAVVGAAGGSQSSKFPVLRAKWRNVRFRASLSNVRNGPERGLFINAISRRYSSRCSFPRRICQG